MDGAIIVGASSTSDTDLLSVYLVHSDIPTCVINAICDLPQNTSLSYREVDVQGDYLGSWPCALDFAAWHMASAMPIPPQARAYIQYGLYLQDIEDAGLVQLVQAGGRCHVIRTDRMPPAT